METVSNSTERREQPNVYARISLDKRIAHVNPIDIGTEPLSARQLGEALATSDRQVSRMTAQLGIEPEAGCDDVTMYPAYALPVLDEEIHWRTRYRQLPATLRIRQLADLLGRSVGDTSKRLDRSGIDPRIVRTDGKPYRTYPKSALMRFREEDMEVAPAHDWLSLGQLVHYGGYDRDWIRKRLIGNGIEPEPRRSAITGRVSDHFPPQTLTLLKELAERRPPPAGDWLTAEALTGTTGRSIAWVNRRLIAYEPRGEFRRDDNGNTRLHYPPDVADALLDESRAQAEVPPKGDNLSRKEMTRALGRSSLWLDGRLEELGAKPEVTRSRSGRLFETFPRALLLALQDL